MNDAISTVNDTKLTVIDTDSTSYDVMKMILGRIRFIFNNLFTVIHHTVIFPNSVDILT